MRIGELSARTGTSRRLLRYYEEQGLIVSQRCANGYRFYCERLADRVLQIRGLLDAGLPTRVIKQILPCLDKPRAIVFSDATPEIIETLEQEVGRMDRHIETLARNRDAVAGYLEEVRAHARADATTGRLPRPRSAPGGDPPASPVRGEQGRQAKNRPRPSPSQRNCGGSLSPSRIG